MACDECPETPDTGCLQNITTECVTYNGEDVTCADISSGQSLNQVIEQLGNNDCDIKELIDYFCNVFNTDAGEFYRIYLNIRNRKESRTLYLDSLRDSLNKKMNDDDNR